MSSSRPGSSLEDLDLTGEEAARLAKAFQDEEFKRLFAEYAAELSDPAQRATYEAEVCALERERGVEARFLHPEPGWALRTSLGGARKCYLNICANALVGKPEAEAEVGRRGCTWRLPHCLSPGREELGRGRPPGGEPRRCLVYDVLFHPEALRRARREPRFREVLHQTALEAVEKHFAPQGLDRANARVLRGVKYKGVPQASLLRTPLPQREGGEQGEGGGPPSPLPPFPTPYTYPPPPPEVETELSPAPEESPAFTTPRWTLRHRSFLDLQDFRPDSTPTTVPRELELSVELPLLRSAAQAHLEVQGKLLELDSPKPAAYKLRLTLPYAVDEAAGKATFDKAARRLVVTLPVLTPTVPTSPFSGEAPQEEEKGCSGLPSCKQEPLLDTHVTASGSPPRSQESHLELILPLSQKPELPVDVEEEAGSPEPGTEVMDMRPLSSLLAGQEEASLVSEATKKVMNPLELLAPARSIDHVGLCVSEAVAPLSLPAPVTPFSHVGLCVSEVSEVVSSPSLPEASTSIQHVGLSVSEAVSPSLSAPATPVSHVGLCVLPEEASSASAPPSVPSPAAHAEEEAGSPELGTEVMDVTPLPSLPARQEKSGSASEATKEVINPSEAPAPANSIENIGLCASEVSEAVGISSLPASVSHVDLCVSEVSEAVSSPSLPVASTSIHHVGLSVSQSLSPSLLAPVTPVSHLDLSVLPEETSSASEAIEEVAPPSPATHANYVGLQEMEQPPNALGTVPQEDPVAPALCARDIPSAPGPALTPPPARPLPCPDDPTKPTTSPSAPLCPPFCCTQDEQTVTLLLQVHSVAPQSLQGEGGTNHYSIRFSSQDSASYSILWQFLPENTLAPPKADISVSPNNIVIVLSKSPETRGLWTKLYFGPNTDTLQERWFVTENNVDQILSSLPSASSSVQKEELPLIEVLDISEDKSQIRLKAQGPRAESGEKGNGCKPSTEAENGLVESQRVSGSPATLATTGQVGKGPSHCSALDPCDPGPSAIPQEESHESELSSPVSKRAPSATQSQPSSGRPAQTGEEEERHPNAAENKHGAKDRPPPAVIKETNMQDGSVQYISQHTTHCAVTFQNALLYELD
nr:PREDICTED: protein kintoun [Anolis carolinensis]|eukprot:XP_016853211.1 PREDICTED: protein kintoun [Anolis carolinensis]